MKTAFIITSAIQVDNSRPLTYSKTRSFFSTEERLRQTVATLASVDQASNDSSQIYIVDTSDTNYGDYFSYQQNLKFIHVKSEFPEIYEHVRSHPNKSYCECLLLYTFLEKYKEHLALYDYIFKLSGRYLLDRSFNINALDQYSDDKIFYKKPMAWEWNNTWGYSMVDLRSTAGDNLLRQYSSVFVGWGRKHQDTFRTLFNKVVDVLSNPNMFHYDIETLSYFYSREYSKDIIETDWIVYGWTGADGKFVRY